MIEPDVGGGFGVRGEFYPEDFLIPFAARHVSRPVKWIEDRRDHLMATNHSREVDCDLEIACTRDGIILGLRGHVFGDMGAYIPTAGSCRRRRPSSCRAHTASATSPLRSRRW
jgi:aerobic carbon-monoxide dehydrogenase large subunit